MPHIHLLQNIYHEYKNIFAFIKASKLKAKKAGLPLCILAGESHQGIREFISKIILAQICVDLGIINHCLESSKASTLRTFSNMKFNSFGARELFLHFICFINSKIQLHAIDCERKEHFVIYDKLVPLEQRRKLLPLFLKGEITRELIMAQSIINLGQDTIFYVGKSHVSGIQQFLSGIAYVVFVDVSHMDFTNIPEALKMESGIPLIDTTPSINAKIDMDYYRCNLNIKEPQITNTVTTCPPHMNLAIIGAKIQSTPNCSLHLKIYKFLLVLIKRKDLGLIMQYNIREISSRLHSCVTSIDRGLCWYHKGNILPKAKGKSAALREPLSSNPGWKSKPIINTLPYRKYEYYEKMGVKYLKCSKREKQLTKYAT